jgi:hypothetical protein
MDVLHLHLDYLGVMFSSLGELMCYNAKHAEESTCRRTFQDIEWTGF